MASTRSRRPCATSSERQGAEEGGKAEGREEGRAVVGTVGRGGGTLEVIQNSPGDCHYSLLRHRVSVSQWLTGHAANPHAMGHVAKPPA